MCGALPFWRYHSLYRPSFAAKMTERVKTPPRLDIRTLSSIIEREDSRGGFGGVFLMMRNER